MFSPAVDLTLPRWHTNVLMLANDDEDDLAMELSSKPEVGSDHYRQRSNDCIAESSTIDGTRKMEDGDVTNVETEMDWETMLTFDVDTQRRPSDVISGDDDAGALCKVCGDRATGTYFGARVCVPCKVS